MYNNIKELYNCYILGIREDLPLLVQEIQKLFPDLDLSTQGKVLTSSCDCVGFHVIDDQDKKINMGFGFWRERDRKKDAIVFSNIDEFINYINDNNILEFRVSVDKSYRTFSTEEFEFYSESMDLWLPLSSVTKIIRKKLQNE